MKPTLGEYMNMPPLTDEQKQFDISIAEKIMGWKPLDPGLKEDFEQHILPASVYPFYEIFSEKGVVTYHPTPYHANMFSPSVSSSDDTAVFLMYLSKHPEQLKELLTTLHFIHHQRSLKDVGFNPADGYYRVTKYYRAGDFATAIWHAQKHDGITEREQDIVKEINKKFLGKYSIHTIRFNNASFEVYCGNKSLITKEIEDYFTSHGYSVVFYERA